ncbi:hypothetical protein S40288_11277 [Stachybotrys chartarum IBT 40288]|nr:hypothetical protein S40288_11277 [Stachybotrys chartarum IBT 40288]
MIWDICPQFVTSRTSMLIFMSFCFFGAYHVPTDAAVDPLMFRLKVRCLPVRIYQFITAQTLLPIVFISAMLA